MEKTLLLNYLNQYVRVIAMFYKPDYSEKRTYYGTLITVNDEYIELKMLDRVQKVTISQIKNIILFDNDKLL